VLLLKLLLINYIKNRLQPSCSEFGLGKAKTRPLQWNLEISITNDYGIDQNPIFHIISKLVNNNFCCKTESSIVFVNLKRILEFLNICLLEIFLFGCNRQRLVPKINVPRDFWVWKKFSQINLSVFHDTTSDAIFVFVVPYALHLIKYVSTFRRPRKPLGRVEV